MGVIVVAVDSTSTVVTFVIEDDDAMVIYINTRSSGVPRRCCFDNTPNRINIIWNVKSTRYIQTAQRDKVSNTVLRSSYLVRRMPN